MIERGIEMSELSEQQLEEVSGGATACPPPRLRLPRL